MKSMIYLLAATCLTVMGSRTMAQHQLTQKWATDSVLKSPESVWYDAGHQWLYVSNIDGKSDEKDGKGSIGKVGLDGKILSVDWVTGLNAPKGLALVHDMLWVADIDQLVVIDTRTAKIVKKIPIQGSKFLNDVTADENGVIYVSDSQTKLIHKVEGDKSSVYLSDLHGPNGVLAWNKQFYLVDNGSLYKVGDGKKLVKIAEGMDNSLDGLEHVQGDDFLVTSWVGLLYYVKGDGTVEKLLDTRDQKINSADIGYDAKNKIVYVPTFFRNSIVAYQLQ